MSESDPSPEGLKRTCDYLRFMMRDEGTAMVIEAMAKDSAFWKQLAQINARSAAEIADKLSSAEARVAELERALILLHTRLYEVKYHD
jgi:hypothetical protein